MVITTDNNNSPTIKGDLISIFKDKYEHSSLNFVLQLKACKKNAQSPFIYKY